MFRFQLVDNFKGALTAGERDVFLSQKKGCSKKLFKNLTGRASFKMFPASSGIQSQVEAPGLWAGKGENFNHPDIKYIGTGIHTLSILRMEAVRPQGGLPGKEIIHFFKAPLDPS